MKSNKKSIIDMLIQCITPFVFISIFTVLAGCANHYSISSDYNYDPDTDLSSYTSYDWLPVPRENVRHGLIIKRVESELDRQLQAGGFILSPDTSDFLIAIHGGLQSRLGFRDWEFLNEEYKSYAAMRRLDVVRYTDNMLIFDFIDSQTKELIYRSIITATTGIETEPDKREMIIRDTIKRVISSFESLRPASNSSGL